MRQTAPAEKPISTPAAQKRPGLVRFVDKEELASRRDVLRAFYRRWEKVRRELREAFGPAPEF
jgi:hypothetical protein